MTPTQREALTKAEATFRRYGDLHAAKPDPVKAAANYELADRMAAARAEVVEPVELGEGWLPCMKLPVVVHVRHQRPGETHVSTREGITPADPDDLIMRGVYGEEYPIGRVIFNQTYRLCDET